MNAKSMIKSAISFVQKPWVLTLTGLAIVCVVIFFGGRVLRENDVLALSDRTLLQICAGALTLAVVVYFWIRYRAVKNALALEHELRENAEKAGRAAEPDRRAEIQALQGQFDEAVTALKESKLGKRALHSLPWTVIVGPPASGKTTMIMRSGLNFPYTVPGSRGLRGVGGTRNCDWWFLDQGVVLDTAGRYTTEPDDHEEWTTFLDLLRRYRKETPINGAIVALSMEDFLFSSDEKIADHASKVRERLCELGERLQQVFPVYLVLTKCDLIEGFVESFRTLEKDERAQVWGCTIPVDGRSEKPVDVLFAEELGTLQDRLGHHCLSMTAESHAVEDVERVHGFPLRFSETVKRLQAFVGLLSQPNPYQELLDLRGFYFTSGAQDVPAIVDIQEGEVVEAAPATGGGRGYFIENLFTKVVFADHHLARRSDSVLRRRKSLRRAGMGVCILAMVALGSRMFVTYFQNSLLIVEVAATMSDIRKLPDSAELLTDNQKTDIDELGHTFVKLDEARHRVADLFLARSDELYPEVSAAYAEVIRKFFLVPCQERLARDLTGYVEARRANQESPGAEVRVAMPVEASFDPSGQNLEPEPPPAEPLVESPGQELSREAGAEASIEFSRKLALYEMVAHERPVEPRAMRRVLEDMQLWSWNPEALGLHGDPDRERIEAHLEWFLERLVPSERRGIEPAWSVAPLSDAELQAVRSARAKEAPIGLIAMAMNEGERLTLAEILPDTGFKGIQQERCMVHRAFATEGDFRQTATVFEVLLEEMPEDESTRDSWRRWGRQELEDRYTGEWKDVLAGIQPEKFGSLVSVAENLERHTGEHSLYEQVYSLVRSKLTDVGALEAREQDLLWLVDALAEIRNLKDDIGAFTSLPDDGQRVMRDLREYRGDHIWDLLEMVEVRWKKVEHRLGAGADPELEPAIRRALRTLVDSVSDTMREVVAREVQEHWESAVARKLWTFEDKYPFSEGGVDVSPGAFADMFRPGTGSFDVAYAELIQLTEPHGVTEPILTFTPEFEDERRSVSNIQKALFTGADGELEFSFTVAMENDADICETQLVFGQDRLSTKAMRPAKLAQTALTWSPEDLGASVRLMIATNPPQMRETQLEERGPTAWSLFRLVESGQPTVSPADDRAVNCSWQFQYDVAGADFQSRHANLKFTSLAELNPLHPQFFQRLQFARRVFRAVGGVDASISRPDVPVISQLHR